MLCFFRFFGVGARGFFAKFRGLVVEDILSDSESFTGRGTRKDLVSMIHEDIIFSNPPREDEIIGLSFGEYFDA